MAFHEVKQGEHLSGIAADYGFPDFTTLWNRPENAALKQKRENPHVLLPGDKVFVPDKTVKEYSRPADNQHTFEVLTKPLFLKLELCREYDDPMRILYATWLSAPILLPSPPTGKENSSSRSPRRPTARLFGSRTSSSFTTPEYLLRDCSPFALATWIRWTKPPARWRVWPTWAITADQSTRLTRTSSKAPWKNSNARTA